MEALLNSNVIYLAIFTWINFVIALAITVVIGCNFLAKLVMWHYGECRGGFSWFAMTIKITALWSSFAALKFVLNIYLTSLN